MVFAIIETAIVFFAGQALETAAADSARLIMTGQAQNAGYDQTKFKQAVCGKIYGLFNCNGGLSVDVKNYPTFASIPHREADHQRQPGHQLRLRARRSRRHRGGAADVSMAGVRVAARPQPLRHVAAASAC